MIYTWWN